MNSHPEQTILKVVEAKNGQQQAQARLAKKAREAVARPEQERLNENYLRLLMSQMQIDV